MDDDSQKGYDRIARLAKRIFGAQASPRHGYEREPAQADFCIYAIAQKSMLGIEATSIDPRFRDKLSCSAGSVPLP